MAVPQTDSLEATTLQLVRPRLVDNFFKSNPSLYWFLANGRVKTFDGGKYISEPLIYTNNPNTMAYRGYDRFNVAPTEEVSDAQYGIRFYVTTFGISGEEEVLNSGAQAKFSMLKAKIQVAELSIRQRLDELLHGPASMKEANKDMLGLIDLLDYSTSWSTVGGINSNTYSFWRNQLGVAGDGSTTGIAPFATAGTFASPVAISSGTLTIDIIKLLNRMINLCHKGGPDSPDLILTARPVYELIESVFVNKTTIYDTKMADLGFEAIKHKNTRIMWNENIESGAGTGVATIASDIYPIYFLNSNYMNFTIVKDRNFKMSAFVSPYDQDAKIAQILFAGNMTLNNRRRQGLCFVDIT